jgi:hypothetical protein
LYPSRFRQLWLAMLEPLFKSWPAERRVFGASDRAPQDNFIFLGAGTFLASDPEGGMDVDGRFNMNLLSLMNVRYLLSYYRLSSKYLVEIHAPARPLEKRSWDISTGRMAYLRESPVNEQGDPATARPWPSLTEGLTSLIKAPPAAEDQVYAYRNVCALPRAFPVAHVERHASDRDVLKSLAAATAMDLKHTAHMVDGEAPPVVQLAPASLRLLKYQGGDIELEAIAEGETVIVFANTWMRGWKAFVDGREASPLRVNHTQVGLHLPKSGTFHVKLAYEPTYRWTNDVFAAPTRLIAGPKEESRIHELSLSQLEPVCASTED